MLKSLRNRIPPCTYTARILHVYVYYCFFFQCFSIIPSKYTLNILLNYELICMYSCKLLLYFKCYHFLFKNFITVNKIRYPSIMIMSCLHNNNRTYKKELSTKVLQNMGINSFNDQNGQTFRLSLYSEVLPLN